MTYRTFIQEMIEFARLVQGDNYAGDDYYDQECWRDYWEDGDSPEEAVNSDMRSGKW